MVYPKCNLVALSRLREDNSLLPIELKIGTFANGSPRLQVYHWNSCKVAHVRDGQEEGARPQLGRKPNPRPNPEPTADKLSASSPETNMADNFPANVVINKTPVEQATAKIQNRPVRSTRNQNPNYV